MRLLFLLVLVMITEVSAQIHYPKFDVAGHRGCRGLRPENTIPAFLVALDSGVTTLEMDAVITKDRQVVLSHEPWMSPEICVDASGQPIAKKDERRFNIFQMTYEEIRSWDCGSKPVERFPQQVKMKVSKPLLRDVIVAVEDHIKNKSQYEVDYNIEIKSLPESDNKFHPKPEEYSDIVYSLLNDYLPMGRVVIQSFDFRVLKYWHEKYPDVRLSALVENFKTVDQNLADLGFVPSIYSPAFKLITREDVKHIHEITVPLTPSQMKARNGNGNGKSKKQPNRLRVIPWTVNDEKDMVAVKGMGVDGFITDYPDRARKYKMTLVIIPKGQK